MLGAISAASGKPPQLEDSYSPYNLMSGSESTTNPLVPPDSWGQGKSPNEKISNGTNVNWPPGEEKIQVNNDINNTEKVTSVISAGAPA